jgi:hypothetical protein
MWLHTVVEVTHAWIPQCVLPIDRAQLRIDFLSSQVSIDIIDIPWKIYHVHSQWRIQDFNKGYAAALNFDMPIHNDFVLEYKKEMKIMKYDKSKLLDTGALILN